MVPESHVLLAWRTLRYTYGAVVFLAGLDKVLATNIIVDWPKYVSPFVAGLLPVSIGTFLFLMGVVEIAVGILAFTRFTRLASALMIPWLLLISVNLVLIGGYLDVAIRDILLAVGAFATNELARGLGYSFTSAPRTPRSASVTN